MLMIGQVACPDMWEAKKLCDAWGAPGPHGCKGLPGHSGPHRCACGKIRPANASDAEFCGCCGNQTHRGATWCASCRAYGHLRKMANPEDCTWFAQHGENCPFQLARAES